MLSEEVKKNIQNAYRLFLQSRGLKARFGQKHMIAAIANALGCIEWNADQKRSSEPSVTAIEAGTGTGKTLAYMLAAIPVVQSLNKTLIVSTATVALQEQIIFRDLPDIKKHSKLTFDFALAKGRQRYVCLSKLDNEFQNTANLTLNLGLDSIHDSATDTQLNKKQTVKLYEEMLQSFTASQWDGEKDSWPDPIDEGQWRQLTTTHTQCTNRKCSYFRQCPFFKSRAQLEKADVIVTNHDMVLSDLHLGGGVVLSAPSSSIYIFDEGHHLPGKTLEHFSYATRLKDSERWLKNIQKQLDQLVAKNNFPDAIDKNMKRLKDECSFLTEPHQEMNTLFLSHAVFKPNETIDSGSSWSYRFPGGVIPEEIRSLAIALKDGFNRCSSLIAGLTDALKKAAEGNVPDLDSVFAEQLLLQISSLIARFDNTKQLWLSYSKEDKADKAPCARWLRRTEFNGQQELHIHSSLIEAGDVLNDKIWDKAGAAIITSATLTALGRFDHFSEQAGLGNYAKYHCFPSPFNYPESGTLNIPALSSDPGNSKEHTEEVIAVIPDLLMKSMGTLVLFASRRQMKNVFKELAPEVKASILLQDQHSKQALLKKHCTLIDSKQKSTIFGLASFAEGIDLPGNYCEHVIIVKIPFSVPDDPVEASLAEWITSNGGNHFSQITVPEAAMRLVQASGRLLRKESDTGTVTILDNRLHTRAYGRNILNTLPPYRISQS